MCTYARELWRSDERENQKTPNSLCTCSVCVGRLEVKVKEKEVSLSYVMPHTYAYYRVNCHSACMWFISHRKYSRKTEQNLSFFFFFWWRVENKKYRSVLWQGIDCQNIRGPNRENRKKKKTKNEVEIRRCAAIFFNLTKRTTQYNWFKQWKKILKWTVQSITNRSI